MGTLLFCVFHYSFNPLSSHLDDFFQPVCGEDAGPHLLELTQVSSTITFHMLAAKDIWGDAVSHLPAGSLGQLKRLPS